MKRIDFESKPVYGEDDKYIKTKIKVYVDNMVTNFHNNKCLKKNYNASVIIILLLKQIKSVILKHL